MIDLYYWTTPNGHKITMMLEETGLEYRIIAVDIGKGAQFAADFLKIAPNNRIPAIVDHRPVDAGGPLSLFESGAILQYLADKSGMLAGATLRERWDINQWLMWQMGGLGPMCGQNHHFVTYAPERIPYAMERYINETARLYAVINRRLQDREFLAGRYSIADIACYPWIVPHERQHQDLHDFPHLQRWFEAIKARPATVAAYERARSINDTSTINDDNARRVLFNQNAATIKN